MGIKNQRQYTLEFKLQAVQLAEGKSSTCPALCVVLELP